MISQEGSGLDLMGFEWMSLTALKHMVTCLMIALAIRNEYYSDVTWAAWRLKSPVTTVSSTASVGSQQRKYQRSELLAICEENPPVTGGFPSQRASNTGKVFPCHEVIMKVRRSWPWRVGSITEYAFVAVLITRAVIVKITRELALCGDKII